MNPIEKASLYYTQLTKSEKETCDKVMNSPHIILNHSILEAAKIFNVSGASISRLCKKLGYKGYSELRYALEDYYNHSEMSQVEQESSIVHLIKNYQLSLDLLKTLDLSSLESLVDKIKNFETYSLGLGTSALAAKLLVHELYVEKKWIDCIDESVKMNLLENVINEHSLIIIFSVTAKHKDMYECIKKWKKKKATIALITSNADTTFCSYIDYLYVLPGITPIQFQNSQFFQYLNNLPLYTTFIECIMYYYHQNTFINQKENITK